MSIYAGEEHRNADRARPCRAGPPWRARDRGRHGRRVDAALAKLNTFTARTARAVSICWRGASERGPCPYLPGGPAMAGARQGQARSASRRRARQAKYLHRTPLPIVSSELHDGFTPKGCPEGLANVQSCNGSHASGKRARAIWVRAQPRSLTTRARTSRLAATAIHPPYTHLGPPTRSARARPTQEWDNTHTRILPRWCEWRRGGAMVRAMVRAVWRARGASD